MDAFLFKLRLLTTHRMAFFLKGEYSIPSTLHMLSTNLAAFLGFHHYALGHHSDISPPTFYPHWHLCSYSSLSVLVFIPCQPYELSLGRGVEKHTELNILFFNFLSAYNYFIIKLIFLLTIYDNFTCLWDGRMIFHIFSVHCSNQDSQHLYLAIKITK